MTRQRQPVKEILYERVTGRSREAVILPGKPTPSPVRMTLRLRPDQRERLESWSSSIYRVTGAKVSASVIVRGPLDAVADAKVELSGCRSQSDVRAALRARLTNG